MASICDATDGLVDALTQTSLEDQSSPPEIISTREKTTFEHLPPEVLLNIVSQLPERHIPGGTREVRSCVLDIQNLVEASVRLEFLVHKHERSLAMHIGAELYPEFDTIFPNEPNFDRLMQLHRAAAQVDGFIYLAKCQPDYAPVLENEERLVEYSFTKKRWEKAVTIGMVFFQSLSRWPYNAMESLQFADRQPPKYAWPILRFTTIFLFELSCKVQGQNILRPINIGAKTITEPWQQPIFEILLWNGDISLIEARIEQKLATDADLERSFANTMETIWSSPSRPELPESILPLATEPGSFTFYLLTAFHQGICREIERLYRVTLMDTTDLESAFDTGREIGILSKILEQELRGKTTIEAIKEMVTSVTGTMK